MIEPVAPAEAMQLPAALLEKRHHRLQRLQRLDAIAGVIAPPRIRPARIALLAAGPEGHQLRAPLRPARAAQRDVEGKEDFVEGHDWFPRVPGAMRRVALAKCRFAEPGPRFLRVASNRGPGSAAHRFAKSYALRCVRGTQPYKLRCPRATARAICPVM